MYNVPDVDGDREELQTEDQEERADPSRDILVMYSIV